MPYTFQTPILAMFLAFRSHHMSPDPFETLPRAANVSLPIGSPAERLLILSDALASLLLWGSTAWDVPLCKLVRCEPTRVIGHLRMVREPLPSKQISRVLLGHTDKKSSVKTYKYGETFYTHSLKRCLR